MKPVQVKIKVDTTKLNKNMERMKNCFKKVGDSKNKKAFTNFTKATNHFIKAVSMKYKIPTSELLKEFSVDPERMKYWKEYFRIRNENDKLMKEHFRKHIGEPLLIDFLKHYKRKKELIKCQEK